MAAARFTPKHGPNIGLNISTFYIVSLDVCKLSDIDTPSVPCQSFESEVSSLTFKWVVNP